MHEFDLETEKRKVRMQLQVLTRAAADGDGAADRMLQGVRAKAAALGIQDDPMQGKPEKQVYPHGAVYLRSRQVGATRALVIKMLLADPKLTQAEIGRQLGITKVAVHKHVHRAIRDGHLPALPGNTISFDPRSRRMGWFKRLVRKVIGRC
ncbi:MAG: winged helix-turn-helix domain-containing protein [Eubacteriales bacterium]|nr:winged helix-turn-helix domain-containing protein [Eubacteriales bacterium]